MRSRTLRFCVLLVAITGLFDVGQHFGCECRMTDDVITGALIPLVAGGWIAVLLFLARRQAYRSTGVVVLAIAMSLVILAIEAALAFFLFLSHACS